MWNKNRIPRNRLPTGSKADILDSDSKDWPRICPLASHLGQKEPLLPKSLVPRSSSSNPEALLWNCRSSEASNTILVVSFLFHIARIEEKPTQVRRLHRMPFSQAGKWHPTPS
jgi:hypothetical protein